MCAHVLLNLLNELRKSDKCEACLAFYFFCNKFNKFNKTVELRWLELVGTVSASWTHRWVRAIPGLTIFKGVQLYFMFTMVIRFLSIKFAKCT